MLNKNDWRLTYQDEFLLDAELKKAEFSEEQQKTDHCHCVFCWEKFSERKMDISEGYCTKDGRYWICEECYTDFKEMFRFKLEP